MQVKKWLINYQYKMQMKKSDHIDVIINHITYIHWESYVLLLTAMSSLITNKFIKELSR